MRRLGRDVDHPKPSRSGVKPWKKDDPTGLTGAVARATSKAHPVHFAEIVRDVRDDYGDCVERTVYRHLRKLVQRGHILKVDVGLDCAAYIRPGSRLMRSPEVIREYMESTREINKTRAHERRARRDQPISGAW